MVDGRLDDWTGPALRIEFHDPVATEPQANSAVVRLAWDSEHLWAAFEVRDGEVFAPPPEIHGCTLYQWDSVELYLDAGGNANPRMDTDDFQFLISCDGRSVVLQGDALLATSRWEVPKNVRDAFAIQSAAALSPEGYTVECAIPLFAMGFDTRGSRPVVGLDLTWNEWTEDHVPLPEPEVNAENLRIMLENHVDEYSLIDADKAELEAAELIRKRAYRPYSWTGLRDFGYPSAWHPVMFTGRPALSELVVTRVGAWNLVLILGLLMTGLGTLSVLIIQRRHRLRVQALLRRLEQLSAAAGTGRTPGTDDGESGVGGEPVPAPPVPETNSEAGLAGWLSSALEANEEMAMAAEDLSGRALTLLTSKPQDITSVSALARTLHVSPRTLQRGLKTELQCSPSELILAVKMRLAHQLLRGGRLRVNEVALQLGYENPEHFSRRFKTYYRCPPSQVLKSTEKPI